MARALTQLLLLSTFVSAALSAQGPSGVAVTGTVVSGASVSLRLADGTEVQSTSADSKGAFRLEGVPPGNYDVKIEKQGFKPFVSRVRVGTRPLQSLTVVLALADLQQQVTVTAKLAQLSTNTADNLDTFSLDRTALDNLPSFDQDFIGTISRFLDAGSVGTSGVTLVVDGVEASRIGVSASAIQEVKLNQDPYSAEFSRPGRGRIEIITKLGSPEYHGTFNFLLRDYRLNARGPFALIRPPEQHRIFECNLTGPLGHSKKTSFLISSNREEEDSQAIIFAQGPSGEIRGTAPTPQRNTELSGSIDHQIGENHLLSIRGVYTDRTSQNEGVGGLTLPEAGINSEDREDIISFNHTGLLTKNLMNQFRLVGAREHTPVTSINPGPKIAVLGAFTGGGAQADLLQTENNVVINEILVWSGAKHTIRAGLSISNLSRRGLDDYTNTLGTYTFSTLEDYQQNHPFSLLRQSGNGHVVFLEKVLAGFVQDEFRVLPNLQISAGVRYDWQNYFHDSNNLAPRVSVAYAPGKTKKTVIRAGSGFFYDRTGPGPIFDLLRYGGIQLRQFLITNPLFPDPFAVGPTSVVSLAPGVRIPYTLQYSASVERQLGRGTTLTVNYTGIRGVHLFRSRDLNAPLPPFYIGRPDPDLSVLRQIESTGDLKSQSLQIGLRGNVTKYFTGMVYYNLGRVYNDVGGINAFPANNYDLSGEWARADFDQRHLFSLLGTVTPLKYLKLGVAVLLCSGRPYNETTGRDDNHDGLANDRPVGVPRNSLQGPGYADVDLRWSHDFFLAGDKKDRGPTVTLGLDAVNVLNHVNYTNYIGDLSSPFFGKPVAAQPPRRLQASFRFRF